jgi:hypothetical protein
VVILGVVKRNNFLIYWLQFHPLFWRLRHGKRLFDFYRSKQGFLLKEKLWMSRWKLSAFGGILSLIAVQILLAVTIVGALKITEHYGYIHGILSKDWIDEAAQLGFFTTVMQVSGALLGLYFTAISVVASTAYAKAPGGVRSLVIHERVGYLYFRSLAFLTVVTTLMVAILSFHRSVGVLNTGLTSVLCVYSVFGFVALGLQAFELFDPSFLVPHLTQQLAKSINAVTPAAPEWEDASLQDFHRRLVDVHLGNYESLVILASRDDNLDGKALVKLAAGLFESLRLYSTQKSTISTLSYWFKRDHGYKSWLLPPHGEAEVALETGTSLRPDKVPDNIWFERRVADILVQIIGKLNGRSETTGLGALGEQLRNTMKCYGQTFSIEEGAYVFRRLSPCFRNGLAIVDADEFKEERRALALNRLGIIDLESSALIEYVLSLGGNIEALDAVTLATAFNDHGSANHRNLNQYVPRSLIEEIEDVQKKLLFEQRALGVEITQQWFCVERLAFRMCSVIVLLSEKLVDLHEETFDRPLKKLVAEKNYFVVAQLVQRGLESCKKCSDALDVCESKYASLLEMDKSKDVTWAKCDWEHLKGRLEQSRHRMIGFLAEVGPRLSLAPIASDIPDYFGLSYSLVAEECFWAMAEDDLDRFKDLFPRFIGMSRLAASKIKEMLSKVVDPNNALIAEPFVDLLSISGYAAIYTDLYRKDFWKIVTDEWDKFLTSLGDGAPGFIEAVSRWPVPTLRISPRDMLRMKWKTSTEEVLRDQGFGSRQDLAFDSDPAEPPAQATPLLKAFAYSSMIEADDVFQAQYMFKRADVRGLELPESVKTFNETIRHYLPRNP